MSSSVPLPKALREFVATSQWTYAKTMPVWPHEYIVRERVDEKLFVKLVRHIRKHGFEGCFYQMKLIYFEEDGKIYWTMGAPIKETTIINRCRKEDSYESRLKNGTLPKSDPKDGQLKMIAPTVFPEPDRATARGFKAFPVGYFGYTDGNDGAIRGVLRQQLTDKQDKELAPMTDDELRAFIKSNYWKFASTMPHCPHWYVLRWRANDLNLWLRFVAHIRRVGECRNYYKFRQLYLNLDDYTYWTCGYPLEASKDEPEAEGCLNRAEYTPPVGDTKPPGS